MNTGDADSLQAVLKGYAADALGTYDSSMIQVSIVGRLEEDQRLDSEEEALEESKEDPHDDINDDALGQRSFHIPSSTSHWFMKASEIAGDPYNRDPTICG